jgi:hypothetical protein
MVNKLRLTEIIDASISLGRASFICKAVWQYKGMAESDEYLTHAGKLFKSIERFEGVISENDITVSEDVQGLLDKKRSIESDLKTYKVRQGHETNYFDYPEELWFASEKERKVYRRSPKSV